MVVTNKTKLKTFSASGGGYASIIEIKEIKNRLSQLGQPIFYIL
jgi:hypothetical protein